ncbi:hypothetical protein DENSPDRAFT_931268 [Dentipellis sp. KUC8613]|nr:hypothetical protein DENSPDRAFT_931268 [Dentipellis sp. KUC8613]
MNASFTQPSSSRQPLDSPLSDAPHYSWSSNFSAPVHKKRKIERACDACRRRKTRCDGPQMSDNICTNCTQARRHCTYLEASKPRGPPKAYVTSLEDRVERAEALLKRLRPEADFSAELGPPIVRDSWKTDAPPNDARTNSNPAPRLPPSIPVTSLPTNATRLIPRQPSFARIPGEGLFDIDREHVSDEQVSEDEDVFEIHLSKSMKRLRLHELEPDEKGDRSLDAQVRFHGSSSPFRLAAATRQLKLNRMNELKSEGASPVDEARDQRPGHQVAESSSLREYFWRSPTWESEWEGIHVTSPDAFPSLRKEFPPKDLALKLIHLYFTRHESIFRLLHRPTFERQFEDGLYTRDAWFACICMCVFALASRYSKDERVLLPVPPGEHLDDEYIRRRWQKAGFKYYFAAMDVVLHKRSLLAPACLFEIQTACLTSTFKRDTHWHPNAWVVIGIGIRKLQDVGGHRKQVYGTTPSVEKELWKRAFWHLVAWDRISSVMLGRPCLLREEDFDVPLPLEVDDEYWENEDPKLAFKQPPGKPSALTAYVLWLKITDIIAYNLRTMYALDKWKGPMGLKDPRRPQEILNQLNAVLTSWATSVPEHLKWSPDIEDPIVANQSATMYIAYNLLQISVNRSYLPPSLSRLRALGAPKTEVVVDSKAMTHLAIAVNCARSVTRIGETIRKRNLANVPILYTAIEICSAVLSLNVWVIKAREKARRLQGLEPDLAAATMVEALMDDINSLLAGLEWAVPRWERAEDALTYLRSAIPSATDEPADLEGVHLEIMSPVEPEYSPATPFTPASANPWATSGPQYYEQQQLRHGQSSTPVYHTPRPESLTLQEEMATLPLRQLMNYLQPQPQPHHESRPKFPPLTIPQDYRPMEPPPLPPPPPPPSYTQPTQWHAPPIRTSYIPPHSPIYPQYDGPPLSLARRASTGHLHLAPPPRTFPPSYSRGGTHTQVQARAQVKREEDADAPIVPPSLHYLDTRRQSDPYAFRAPDPTPPYGDHGDSQSHRAHSSSSSARSHAPGAYVGYPGGGAYGNAPYGELDGGEPETLRRGYRRI